MVRPEHISFENWAASLYTDFPDQLIPQLHGTLDWRDWATSLISSGIFNECPAPSEEDDWQSWAVKVYGFIQK